MVQVLASGNELPLIVQGVHHAQLGMVLNSEHNYTRMIKTWPQYNRECTYVTGYEKIDRCDNKLKSSICVVKSIYLNFLKKNIFGGFSETFTIKLSQVKFLADLDESFFGKKKGFYLWRSIVAIAPSCI